jgi:hypothetical protein
MKDTPAKPSPIEGEGIYWLNLSINDFPMPARQGEVFGDMPRPKGGGAVSFLLRSRPVLL